MQTPNHSVNRVAAIRPQQCQVEQALPGVVHLNPRMLESSVDHAHEVEQPPLTSCVRQDVEVDQVPKPLLMHVQVAPKARIGDVETPGLLLRN